GSNAPLSTPYSCWGDRPGDLLHQAGRDRQSRGVGDEAMGAAGAAARSRPGRASVTGTPDDLDRLRLVASAMAGRPLTLERAADDAPGYTDGRVVYLPAGERPELLAFLAVQGALLGAGSLDPGLVKRLSGRAGVARRYLAVEGWRALAEMADRLPGLPLVEAAVRMDHPSSGPEQSLELALGRRPLADPPPAVRVIRPGRIRAAADAVTATAPTPRDLAGDVP